MNLITLNLIQNKNPRASAGSLSEMTSVLARLLGWNRSPALNAR